MTVTGVVRLDELERVVHIGLLYDFYGPLLTQHQREAVDLYFLRNWSMQEIADAWSTSRQAVHDLVTRAVHQLEGYEDALGLLSRDRRFRAILAGCEAEIEEARDVLGDEPSRARELLLEAIESVRRLLETL